MLGLAFCYIYVYNFFQTWFHTFLVRGRGFSEGRLVLSALPFVVAGSRTWPAAPPATPGAPPRGTRGRRFIGATALAVAAVFTLAAMFTQHQLLTVVLPRATYGAITFQQSGCSVSAWTSAGPGPAPWSA